jgi:hypothetical protein
MTIRWPIGVLRARDVSFDIAPRTLAGPTSVSGKTQTVSTDAGIWKATLGSIVIRDRNTRLAFRAIANLMEGRLNPILVPLCRGDQPIPSVDGLYEDVPHSDEADHDDDTGYVGRVINVVTAAMAPRATSGAVTVAHGAVIEPGQHFSIGERLYRLRTVVWTGASTANITFRPPIREAVAFGTYLNFDDPVCRMRLVDDAQMDLDLQGRRFGAPSVSFVEDI